MFLKHADRSCDAVYLRAIGVREKTDSHVLDPFESDPVYVSPIAYRINGKRVSRGTK
jgi:hypothetical protein